MSATLASPLNTGSTVPALTPVTVPCRTPTCAWAPAATSNSTMTIDDVFGFFMLTLRYPVTRRLAGSDALYWRGPAFGYPPQFRVEPGDLSGFAQQPFDLSVAAARCLRGHAADLIYRT